MQFRVQGDVLLTAASPVRQVPSSFAGGRFSRPPAIIVIHFTAGGSALSSAEWFRDRRNAGSSAHVVIDRNGAAIQCVPLTRVAWHAGRSVWRGLSGLNAHSFGIELANWGALRRSDEGWLAPTGVRVPNPVLARHRNGNPGGTPGAIGWEPYPAAQVAAAAGVARALASAFGSDEIVGHDDIAPGRKWDPGPAWDMAAFRTAVFGEENAKAA